MLASMLGASRFWFNAALGEVKARLDARDAGAIDVDLMWSYKRLCSGLDAGWRNKWALWQADLPCGTYMAGFEALGAPLQNHSKGKASGHKVGFPRFKRRGRCSESVLFQRPRILDARQVELQRSLGPLRSKESTQRTNGPDGRPPRTAEAPSEAIPRAARPWLSPPSWATHLPIEKREGGRHTDCPLT